MIYLHHGDVLPSVGILQRLINRCRRLDRRLSGISELSEDGIYLRGTRRAVRQLQDALEIHPRDGIVGPDTWRRLADMAKWRVVDICDLAVEGRLRSVGRRQLRQNMITDCLALNPGAMRSEAERLADRTLARLDREVAQMRSLVMRLTGEGGQPIELTDVTRVFETIRRGIAARSRDGWQVVLIRFQAHGHAGHQGIAGSLFGRVEIDRDALAVDPGDTREEILQTMLISRMTVPMARFGCVELHGCNIAARRPASRQRGAVNGPASVQAFANCVGRPVSAGTGSNLFGNIRSDIRIEGSVVSAMPSGGTVRQWFDRH